MTIVAACEGRRFGRSLQRKGNKDLPRKIARWVPSSAKLSITLHEGGAGRLVRYWVIIGAFFHSSRKKNNPEDTAVPLRLAFF